MARAPNEKQIKAKELYDKGYKLIDISKKLDTAESTIRVWKNRFNWDNKECSVSEKKCNVTDNEKHIKNETDPIVKELIDNDNLSPEHKMFCVIYAKRQNATKAYQKVYHCTYETAMTNGPRLLRNAQIKERINLLLEEELNKEFLKKGLIQQYKDIAFSDIGDYIEFGMKRIPQWKKDDQGNMTPIMDPNTGEQMIKEYSYVELKDSVCVDTSLITEVSEGKDGIKFKLADKMKAMEMLVKLSNLLSDEEKTQLDNEFKKVQIEKAKAEIKNITGEPSKEESTDDGFIEALNGTVQEDWGDEKEDI